MATPPNADRVTLTPSEAAQILGVHLKSVYKLIDAGKLPAKRLGQRQHRILIKDFEAFLESDDWTFE